MQIYTSSVSAMTEVIESADAFSPIVAKSRKSEQEERSKAELVPMPGQI